MTVLARRRTDELAAMRAAGRVVAEMHDRIRAAIRPGVTTDELDRIGREVLARREAVSNFLGYHGFPAVICASPNDVVIHGIPNRTPLVDGDIVSIDCGAVVRGWHGDAAATYPVGTISADAARLVRTAEAALWAGIDRMCDGARLSDIGHAIQTMAESAGFSVVREYVGHGIGTAMHEEPDVPNVGPPGRGALLRPGMTLAVEPMVCAGSGETRVLDDGWSVVTTDGGRAAHVEHTVVVGDDGPVVLTAL